MSRLFLRTIMERLAKTHALLCAGRPVACTSLARVLTTRSSENTVACGDDQGSRVDREPPSGVGGDSAAG